MLLPVRQNLRKSRSVNVRTHGEIVEKGRCLMRVYNLFIVKQALMQVAERIVS